MQQMWRADGTGGDSRTRTLVVSRDFQVWGCANKYKVIINGNFLGNVPVGGELRTTVASAMATVEIICTTFKSNERRRLILKLGDNPRVAFKIQRAGMIGETVYDAEVVERR